MSVEPSDSKIFHFYYTKIMDVLFNNDSTNIHNIGTLLRKFPGKEYHVYAQICRKCGVQPEEQPTAKEIAAGPRLNESPTGAVSNWLSSKGFKVYAAHEQFRTMKWETFMAISSEERLQELGVLPRHALSLLGAIHLEASPLEAAKAVALPASKPDREVPASKQSDPGPKSDFEVGEHCFTKVVKTTGEKDVERWLNARVTNVNDDNTFDIIVLQAKAHGVPPEAVDVPRSFLKKSSDHITLALPELRPRHSARYIPGDRVLVYGLRSHTDYNGICGTILLHMGKERRYQVRLDTGDVFAIRPRNISPEIIEVPKEALEAGTKKMMEASGSEEVSQEDKEALSDLIVKLMRNTPTVEHKKLGEFAAGYLIAVAKQKSD